MEQYDGTVGVSLPSPHSLLTTLCRKSNTYQLPSIVPLGPMRLPGWLSVCLIVLVFRSAGLEAQTDVPGLHHLRWQLLDIVILPDSSFGVWLLVAPNPRAVQ